MPTAAVHGSARMSLGEALTPLSTRQHPPAQSSPRSQVRNRQRLTQQSWPFYIGWNVRTGPEDGGHA